ncbi:MAG: polymer-forming cytoskeletal protein [Thermomicrobiales bacterium]
MRDITAIDFEWNDDASAPVEAASLVDRGSAFEGVFRSQRDLRVEGELKGTVACEGTLFIAEGATVSATVDAEHINVAGDLQGEIRCRGRLQILPSGRVRARVTTGTLVIQEGAVYEGQLEMAGVERATPRPLRARPAPAPVSIESAASERQSGATFVRRLGSPETAWDGGEAPAGDSAARATAADAPAT